VAASARPVGSAALGGGWELGVTVGPVHPAAPFTAEAREALPTLLPWVAAAPLSAARYGQTATPLGNGKVLVAGGLGSGGFLASAELYDPASGTWSSAGNMSGPRIFHAATLLPSGQVLVTGGSSNGITPLSGAEVYDPTSNAWSAAADMRAARRFQTATLLGTGKVLVAGGMGAAAAFWPARSCTTRPATPGRPPPP
jgi:hypothetical protein